MSLKGVIHLHRSVVVSFVCPSRESFKDTKGGRRQEEVETAGFKVIGGRWCPNDTTGYGIDDVMTCHFADVNIVS